VLQPEPSFRPVRRRDGYLALEDMGLIGDGTTSALVGLDGSIPWLCLPRFDSEPLFCGLLDDARGGSFTVAPEEVMRPASQQPLQIVLSPLTDSNRRPPPYHGEFVFSGGFEGAGFPPCLPWMYAPSGSYRRLPQDGLGGPEEPGTCPQDLSPNRSLAGLVGAVERRVAAP
jgi:hypothetical protein